MYREFPGRDHFLIAEPGWQEVAGFIDGDVGPGSVRCSRQNRLLSFFPLFPHTPKECDIRSSFEPCFLHHDTAASF